MTETQQISQLGYALLGLIAMKPSTGYELRKIFESSPMGRYSSSPGAIYPALKKLQQTRAVATKEIQGKTARAAQELSITSLGKKSLTAWMRTLPDSEDIGRDFDTVLLKFSYLDLLQDARFSNLYLDAIEEGLRDNLKTVQDFVNALPKQMPVHGRMSLDLGLATIRTQIRWARQARAQLNSEKPNA